MDIRQIIMTAMAQQELSQRRLSEITGITQPRISDYLTGKRDVQSETLGKILKALRLEIRPTEGR